MAMNPSMTETSERGGIGMMNPAGAATALDPEIEDTDDVHEHQFLGTGGRGRGTGRGETDNATAMVADGEVRRGIVAGETRSTTTTTGRSAEVGGAPAAGLRGQGRCVVAETRMVTGTMDEVLSNGQGLYLHRAISLP
jgi:hypothetical protein